jgi:hypothetical protein
MREVQILMKEISFCYSKLTLFANFEENAQKTEEQFSVSKKIYPSVSTGWLP